MFKRILGRLDFSWIMIIITTFFIGVLINILYYTRRFYFDISDKLYSIEFSANESLEFIRLSMFGANIESNLATYSFTNYGMITAVGALVFCVIAWMVFLWMGQNADSAPKQETTDSY